MLTLFSLVTYGLLPKAKQSKEKQPNNHLGGDNEQKRG
jgi:hypothetical protein